jgi:hypothetical protein
MLEEGVRALQVLNISFEECMLGLEISPVVPHVWCDQTS